MRSRIGSGILLLVLVISIGLINADEVETRYLVDVRLSSLDVAGELQAAGFDVAGVNRAESTAGVIVTDEELNRLESLGLPFTILESNQPAESIEALQDYLNPQELSNLMDQVVIAYPNLVEKSILTEFLFEGQVQYVMKITGDVGEDNDRPSFILDSQHHAREVMTPEIAWDMIDYLTSRYDTDPQVRRWVDNINIYIVPSVNPDGAMYVFQSDNMWRKNRRPVCAVDNNRNYPFGWDSCNGSSGECTDPLHRGLEPASEPETQGMMQLVSEVHPFFTLSYHSYGEYICYSYGCHDPDERAALDDVAQDMNDILENDDGVVGQYDVGPIWDEIYVVDGGSIDTQYGIYGAYSFTIEVNRSFQPDYATMRDITVERQRVAWQFLLDRTLDGPQISGKVTDAVTGDPLAATVQVQEVVFTHGEAPRHADSRGLYHWLAEEGQTYNVDYSIPGYCPATREVTVGTGPSVVDVALVPPTPPDMVAAVGNGDNRIDVSWSSALDAVEYRILRSLYSGGPYEEVGVVAAPATSFQDTTVSGLTTYYYVVRAMQPCDSGDSVEASASTTGTCFTGPVFSGLATVSNTEESTCALELAWPAATARCGGTVTYRVYRSDSAPFTPGPGNLIASGLTTNSYTDHDALANEGTYHYIVRAVDAYSGADDGNMVMLSGSPTGAAVVGTWSDDAGDTTPAGLTGESPWAEVTEGGKTAPKAYSTGSYPNEICAALTTPVLTLGSGATLSFASKYDIEGGWDAGIVEVAEGPTFDTWAKLETVNYPNSLTNVGNACGFPKSGSGTVFSRFYATPAYAASDYTGSLSGYDGKDVKLRWRISSDVTGSGQGWWIDDISVTNTSYREVCTPGTAPVPTEVSPAGSPMTASRTAAGTAVDLVYSPGCGAVFDAVYSGNSPIEGAPVWSEVTCSIDNTGESSFDPGDPPTGGFIYFVIVGQSATTEGSYGHGFDGTVYIERAESSGTGSCDLPQDLTGTCP